MQPPAFYIRQTSSIKGLTFRFLSSIKVGGFASPSIKKCAKKLSLKRPKVVSYKISGKQSLHLPKKGQGTSQDYG
jgi:hypothetical protein